MTGKPIRLDTRLGTVAKMVRQGNRVADIGTDHGYLAAYLLQTDRSPYVYACDINSQPLKRAEQTIRQYALQDRASLLLSNGLQALAADQVDDIVIAGMGGELIASILENCPWSKSSDKHYIFQPMSKADLLRRWLCSEGFAIQKEIAVEENRHLYTVMSVVYTGMVQESSDLFEQVGKMPETPGELSLRYLLWRKEVVLRKAEGIAKSEPEQANRLFVLAQEIAALEK